MHKKMWIVYNTKKKLYLKRFSYIDRAYDTFTKDPNKAFLFRTRYDAYSEDASRGEEKLIRVEIRRSQIKIVK